MKPDPKDICILAVDDSEEDGRLHEMILAEAGYKVVPARSAREAKTLLIDEKFDILLVDLRLGDAEGLTLLQPARVRNRYAVAVVLTGFASTQNAVAALKAGAYDFLTKPCTSETLVHAIERAAEKYHLSSKLGQRTEELEELNTTLDRRVRDATQEIFSLNEKLKHYISDLVESNNDQTRALEEMAHELKNPLSVITGYSSFLLRGPMAEWTPAELTKSIQSIRKNAQNLQALIDELLDSSRISSRKIKLEKKNFPAIEAVSEAADALHLQAEEAEVELLAECEENCVVSADHLRLRQILVNLLTNAVKYTPPGGTIKLSAKNSPDGGVLFTVEDTGRGMEAEEAKRIFERFYQIQIQGKLNRGLGLGLNIVEGLVKLHKGRIWVDSAPGKGSRFFVFLPEERVSVPASVTN